MAGMASRHLRGWDALSPQSSRHPDALDAAHAGDLISACHRPDAFINEVAAQGGTKLTEIQAAQLTLRAQNVRVALG